MDDENEGPVGITGSRADFIRQMPSDKPVIVAHMAPCIQLDPADSRADLSGSFDAAELRAIADWLDARPRIQMAGTQPN